MTYAYERISTDSQDAANQRYEIELYALSHSIKIDEWIEETASGAKKYEDRQLGSLMERAESGDKIIVTEISRLGRSMTNLFTLTQELFDKQIQVYAVKQNFEIKNDLQSKILIFAFGIAAEIERDLISQRTRQALARKKSEGVKLGRKPGSRNKEVKLTKDEPAIRSLLAHGCNYSQIARLLECDRSTLTRYIDSRMPDLKPTNRSHTLPESVREMVS